MCDSETFAVLRWINQKNKNHQAGLILAISKAAIFHLQIHLKINLQINLQIHLQINLQIHLQFNLQIHLQIHLQIN